MKNNKIIIIEDDLYILPWIRRYKKIIKKTNDTSKILFNLKDVNDADRMAFDFIHESYKEFSNEKICEILDQVLNSPHGHFGFLKRMQNELKNMLLSFAYANRMIEKHGITQEVAFIPKHFNLHLYEIFLKSNKELSQNFTIPPWYIKSIQRKNILKLLFYKFILKLYLQFLLLLIIVKKIKAKDHHIMKESYKHGIYWLRDQGFGRALYCANSFISENITNQDDVIFIVDGMISGNELKKIKEFKYHYIIIDEIVSLIGCREYLEIYRDIKSIKKVLLKIKIDDYLIARILFILIHKFVLWKIFYSRTFVKEFISHQQPVDPFVALMQKKYGSKINMLYWSSGLTFDWACRSDFTHLVFDKFISSKVPIFDFKKNNYNNITQFVNIGILNSDIIYKIKNNHEFENSLKKEIGVPKDKIILAVFDDNTEVYTHFSISHTINYFKLILQLLNANDEYFMLFKPRVLGIFNEHEELTELFNNIVNNDRCILINKLDEKYTACEIMGISNIVITVYSSSTLFESLAGGMKTICYKPHNLEYALFWDFIDKMPNVSFYNNETFMHNINFWLNMISEEEHIEFKKNYVMRYVDNFSDGCSLNRLKKVLA